VTVEIAAIAVIGGIAGGAIAGMVIGALQAWMARPRGGRLQTFARASDASAARAASGTTPFARFNADAKRVLGLAQDEAIRHGHNYIGTEHLLTALLRGPQTIAGRALTSLGVELDKVRMALDFIVGRGDTTTAPTEITLSPRTKKVLELAVDEARGLGQGHVGPEHILLGLVREGEGIASGILESLGLQQDAVRARVLELLKPAA
jgi:ATP-dependent Clp protease ATP-binding subunit ClpC